MSESGDSVIVHIDSMLSQLSSNSPSSTMIFKVRDHIRRVNEHAYDPQIVSIGPIHHNKDHVKDMEQHKAIYLHQLLRRRNETSVKKYVVELRKLEEKARKCYTNSIQLPEKEKFVEMLLLDGIFVIELLRKVSFEDFRDENDYILQSDQLINQLGHDLLMIENQLPFFVLSQLFDMTKTNENLRDLVLQLGRLITSPDNDAVSNIYDNDTDDHLLGLLYRTYISNKCIHRNQSGEYFKLEGINSTSDLQEAGIQFKKGKGNSLADVSFTNGVMELSEVIVDEGSEAILRNLIAYEQAFVKNHPRYMSDYAFFMHFLVNSTKDVEILRRAGIITTWIGDDETVHLMFKRLGENAVNDPIKFSYTDIFKNVNEHCRRRRNRWMANLKRNYFNSPWAIVSVIAAIILLLLTAMQTVFSALPYIS